MCIYEGLFDLISCMHAATYKGMSNLTLHCDNFIYLFIGGGGSQCLMFSYLLSPADNKKIKKLNNIFTLIIQNAFSAHCHLIIFSVNSFSVTR